jgi:hypothetical protein
MKICKAEENNYIKANQKHILGVSSEDRGLNKPKKAKKRRKKRKK